MQLMLQRNDESYCDFICWEFGIDDQMHCRCFVCTGVWVISCSCNISEITGNDMVASVLAAVTRSIIWEVNTHTCGGPNVTMCKSGLLRFDKIVVLILLFQDF